MSLLNELIDYLSEVCSLVLLLLEFIHIKLKKRLRWSYLHLSEGLSRNLVRNLRLLRHWPWNEDWLSCEVHWEARLLLFILRQVSLQEGTEWG